MNEAELKRNEVLTEVAVQDLNDSPKLPYEDNAFDFITNVVSVDYLTKPLAIFKCCPAPPVAVAQLPLLSHTADKG